MSGAFLWGCCAPWKSGPGCHQHPRGHRAQPPMAQCCCHLQAAALGQDSLSLSPVMHPCIFFPTAGTPRCPPFDSPKTRGIHRWPAAGETEARGREGPWWLSPGENLAPWPRALHSCQLPPPGSQRLPASPHQGGLC